MPWGNFSKAIQADHLGAARRDCDRRRVGVARGDGGHDLLAEPHPGLPELRAHFQVETLTSFTYRVVAPPRWAGQVRGKGWHELGHLPWIGTPPASIWSPR